MTKNTKIAIAVGSAVLVGLTVFMLVRKRRDEDIEDAEVIQEDEQTPVKPQPTTTPTLGIGETVNKAFPLKRGSKGDKVKELQRAIIDYDVLLLQNPPKQGDDKLYYVRGKDDGKFDELTEIAVKQILGKKTIDSQADIDKIKNSRNKTNKERIKAAKELKKWYYKKPEDPQPSLVAQKNTNYLLRGKVNSCNKKQKDCLFNAYVAAGFGIGTETKLIIDSYGFLKYDNTKTPTYYDPTTDTFTYEYSTFVINPLDYKKP